MDTLRSLKLPDLQHLTANMHLPRQYTKPLATIGSLWATYQLYRLANFTYYHFLRPYNLQKYKDGLGSPLGPRDRRLRRHRPRLRRRARLARLQRNPARAQRNQTTNRQRQTPNPISEPEIQDPRPRRHRNRRRHHQTPNRLITVQRPQPENPNKQRRRARGSQTVFQSFLPARTSEHRRLDRHEPTLPHATDAAGPALSDRKPTRPDPKHQQRSGKCPFAFHRSLQRLEGFQRLVVAVPGGRARRRGARCGLPCDCRGPYGDGADDESWFQPRVDAADFEEDGEGQSWVCWDGEEGRGGLLGAWGFDGGFCGFAGLVNSFIGYLNRGVRHM